MAIYAVTQAGGVPVLKAAGSMDRADGETFRMKLDAILATAPDALIVDLSGLRRIGSAGMRVLTQAHQQLAGRDGRLVIAGLHGEALEAFQIGRIDTLLEMTATVGAALEICRSGSASAAVSDTAARRWAMPGG